MKWVFRYNDGTPDQVFTTPARFLGKGKNKKPNPEYQALNRKIKYRLFGHA